MENEYIYGIVGISLLFLIFIYFYHKYKIYKKIKKNRDYGKQLEKEFIDIFKREAKNQVVSYQIAENVMLKTKEDVDILISQNGFAKVCIDIKSQWGLYQKNKNENYLYNKNGKRIEKDYISQVKRQKQQTSSFVGVLWCPNAKKDEVITICDNIFIVNGSVFLLLRFLNNITVEIF